MGSNDPDLSFSSRSPFPPLFPRFYKTDIFTFFSQLFSAFSFVFPPSFIVHLCTTPFFNSSDTVFDAQRFQIVFSLVGILFHCILNYMDDNENLPIDSCPGDLKIVALGISL